MKIYQAIVDALVAEGVANVFGLMGDGNMLIMAEAARESRLHVTYARHEGAALTMAAGATIVSGGVGVCTVTCGPGLTQLGTALTDAVRGGIPIVVLAGDLASTDTYINQFFVQRPFVEATGARYEALVAPESTADVLAGAFFAARSTRTPVVVGVPIHLQDVELSWGWEYSPSMAWDAAAVRADASTEAVADLADRLSSSRRPVIVAGAGAVAAGVRDGLLAVSELTGALCATTLRAKGFFAGSALDVGIAGAFSSRAARQLLADADLVLAVGASLNYFTTEGGYLFGDAEVVSLDLHGPRFQLHQVVANVIQADAGLVIPSLVAELRKRGSHSGYRDSDAEELLKADEPVELLQPAIPGEGLHPVEATRELDAAAPEDAAFVIGVGHFWSFPIMYLTGRRPDCYHVTHDFGSIGQALPTAIGFATARPDRSTIVIEGDGSVLMHIQELETLARSSLPLLIVIMNDGAYGAEVHKLRAKGLLEDGATFGGPDLAAIAAGFGLRSSRATAPGEVRSAVAAFLADPRPTLVDVSVAPSVISGPYLRTVFGRDE